MKYTPEQQKANRDKWIEALRSGEFLQTSGVLRDVDDDGKAQYCCLGVACELASREGVILPRRPAGSDDGTFAPAYGEHGQGGEYEELPDPVKDWLGLATREGRLTIEHDGGQHLVDLNDSGDYDFPALAEVIASEQVKLAEATS